MPYEEQKPFEQIMATVFTCRSVVKYNLALNEQQKIELLTDIDNTLQVLRANLVANLFIGVLSGPLYQQKARENNTVPLKDEDADKEDKGDQRALLLPLLKAYEVHRSVNEKSDPLTTRINDATIFLAFLKENYSDNVGDHHEFIVELDNAVRLLRELMCLLANYKEAAVVLLHRT